MGRMHSKTWVGLAEMDHLLTDEEMSNIGDSQRELLDGQNWLITEEYTRRWQHLFRDMKSARVYQLSLGMEYGIN